MEENEIPVEQKASGPGLMTLIKAVAFISVLVLIQVAATSMIIPSAEETTEIAKALATADSEEEAADSSAAATDEEGKSLLAASNKIEVSLGTYSILTQNINSGTRTNVGFDLFATVLQEDDADFMALYRENEQRIREQVIVTVRAAEITDLTDPTLGLIKRKILEKTNRALGKPLLHEAIFSRFSFEER
jgi:flagellar FliL protein